MLHKLLFRRYWPVVCSLTLLLGVSATQARPTTTTDAANAGLRPQGIAKTQLATYCSTGLGGGSCDITRVQITGTTFNTTASGCPGNTLNNYSLYAPSTASGTTACSPAPPTR